MHRPACLRLSVWLWLTLVTMAGRAEVARANPADAEPTIHAADAALQRGDFPEAIRVASELLSSDPKDFRVLFLRASAYEGAHDNLRALTDYNAGLKLNPSVAFGYQNRGAVHFRLGHFTESVADFDKFLELTPAQAPHHWQRGISLYYAGRYEDGRKQFELHQTVNPHDVENAVWHFLCVAKASGLEKARAALIPIEGDARVPMKQVHALFAGKAKPDDVLAAARAASPSAEQLDNRLFYAHLYLGLYYDATGDTKLTREHIFKAAAFKADHYMGDVARVHAGLLKKR
jgi:lipoprotein NlpI